MLIRVVVLLVVLAACVACGASEERSGRAAFGDRSGPTVSNTGTPAKVSAAGRSHSSVARAWLLAKRGDAAFYRVQPKGGAGPCWGISKVGDADPTTYVHGSFNCGWPPGKAVLDLSTVEASVEYPVMHYWSLAGIAADEVATIQVLDVDKKLLAEVPVVDNVYRLWPVPKHAVDLRAVDASGKVVWKDGTGAVRAIRRDELDDYGFSGG